MYRPMSLPPGMGAIGAIDNPTDLPGGALPPPQPSTVDLSSYFNNLNGQDTAAQIPQSSSVDLTSAFYYLTGGTPPSNMQTPAGQNPNIVSTPGNLLNNLISYVQQNPGASFLFAILLMVLLGASSTPDVRYRRG